MSYLFEDPSGAKPIVGRIVLLRENREPKMAFRVLHVLFEKRQFIARRVRNYKDQNVLELKKEYTAVERVRETNLPNPMLNPEERVAIDELKEFAPSSAVTAPQPSDFSRSDELPLVTPTPSATPSVEAELENQSAPLPTLSEKDELDELDSAQLNEEPEEKPENSKKYERIQSEDEVRTIDDIESMDQENQALWGQFGMIRALNYNGEFVYYPAGGLKYGITLGRMLFVSKAKVQDTLTLELSAMMFRVQGYYTEETLDSYTVGSGVASLRYTVLMSENLGFFVYGGYNPRRVITSGDEGGAVHDNAMSNLGQPQVAAGVGLVFRLGPGWEARIDAGLDTLVAMGVGIRF